MPTYHPSFSFLFCPRLLKIADRETSSVVVRMEMIYLGLCIDVADCSVLCNDYVAEICDLIGSVKFQLERFPG